MLMGSDNEKTLKVVKDYNARLRQMQCALAQRESTETRQILCEELLEYLSSRDTSTPEEKYVKLQYINQLLMHLDIAKAFSERPWVRQDWRYMANYIESGGLISADMRKFLAAVLRGDEKRPPQRIKSVMTAVRNKEIASFVGLFE
jgi:hypothetical protein